MKRYRSVVKRGGSYFIKLEPADLKDYSLVVGDTVLIDDIIKFEDRQWKKKH